MNFQQKLDRVIKLSLHDKEVKKLLEKYIAQEVTFEYLFDFCLQRLQKDNK